MKRIFTIESPGGKYKGGSSGTHGLKRNRDVVMLNFSKNILKIVSALKIYFLLQFY